MTPDDSLTFLSQPRPRTSRMPGYEPGTVFPNEIAEDLEETTMSEEKISVDDGKYTFSQNEQTREIEILRHGNPWVKFSPAETVGFNAIAALMYRAIELEKDHATPV